MLIAAKDVDEAVALANEFRKEGRYELFRGQTRNWNLASTLVRRAATHDREVKRLKEFLGWVETTKGLEALASNRDSAIAVAQHYGIATHFIDFTTEPSIAGYFASEGIVEQQAGVLDLDAEKRRFFGGEPATPEIGCILCLSRDRLLGVWESVKAATNSPVDVEFLDLTVPDLWRLEAQHGLFFFCPAARFEEVVYDLDRIVFPHSGQVKSPSRAMIYPDRKSQLELLLDEYFLLRRIADGNSFFEEEMTRNAIQFTTFHFDDPPENDHRYLADGPLPVHPSWERADLTLYDNPPPERFFDAHTTETCRIRWPQADARGTATAICDQVIALLRSTPHMRRRLVRWIASDEGISLAAPFGKAATVVFDAIRALPVSNEDIARAIGNCAGLLVANDDLGAKAADPQPQASAHFLGYETVAVEIGTFGKGYARAWIGRQDLLDTFREDLMKFFNEQGRARYTQWPQYLLSEVGDPRRLFPLDRFFSLFYAQVVPTQAVLRPDLPLVASPTRVARFGLP